MVGPFTVGDRLSLIGNRSADQRLLADDGFEKRRLAGAVGANQADDVAFGHVHAHVLQRLDVAIADADIVDGKQITHSSSSLPR